MTVEEVQNSIKELKAQGWDEQEILGAFYAMFQDDKIDLNELEALCDVLGYRLTDEFKNMSPEDQKTKGYEESDEEVDKEQVEAAKEIPDSEEKEKPEEKDEDEKPADDEKEDDEKKARRLFGYED